MSRRPRLAAAALSLLALALLAPAARAQQAPARVAVALPACKPPAFDAGTLLSLLSIELRSDGVEQVSESAEGAVATLRVEQPPCDQPRLLLVLEDRLTGKTAGRGVDLSTLDPAARPRFVALSSAELLRASWLELLSQRPAAEDPVTRAVRARAASLLPLPPAPPPASAPPPAPPASLACSAACAPAPAAPSPPEAPPASGGRGGLWLRGYPAARAGLWGPWLGAGLRLGPSAALLLEARGAQGEARDALGSVRLRQGAASAALVREAGAGRLSVRAGPLLELGAAHVAGVDAGPSVEVSSATRLHAAAGARAELRGVLSGRWSWQAGFEGGVTLAGVTALADGRAVVGLAGPWMGLSFGLGAGL